MTVFHRLNIAEVATLTPDSVAITFEVPDSLAGRYHYQPGQHLTLRACINGEELRRCYSICSAPQDNRLQIGVRAVDGGRFSRFLQQQLQPGDGLDVMLPQGRFGYQPQAGRQANYLAVAAGSGITPLLSIIKSTLLLEQHSQFTLIYGNRSGRSVMFKEALSALKNRFPERLQIFWLFSQESTDSPLLSGRIDRHHLQQFDALVRFSHYQRAFICGPETMMDEVEAALIQAGMRAERLHRERFNSPAARPHPAPSARQQQVVLLLEGRRIEVLMTAQDRSILDAALRQGVDLPYACKGGVCATCKCRLKSGKVSMAVNYSLEADQLADGYILSCQSWPQSEDVVVDFDV